MHARAALRQSVRDAVLAHDRFADFSLLRRWSANIDAQTLPAVLVATPEEQPRRVAVGQVNRLTDLRVSLRRLGGDDMDDVLDEDSAVLETIVLPLLEQVAPGEFDLTLIETKVNEEANKSLGMLDMTFSLVRRTAEGAQV